MDLRLSRGTAKQQWHADRLLPLYKQRYYTPEKRHGWCHVMSFTGTDVKMLVSERLKHLRKYGTS